MTARLYALDGKLPAGTVRIDAAELAELRQSAKNAAEAYHAGFLDGREQHADELGVSLPPRVRTPRERMIAEHAALNENAIRAVWDAAFEHAARTAPPPAAHSAPQLPRLRAIDARRATKEGS